jgi:hypothetical protein
MTKNVAHSRQCRHHHAMRTTSHDVSVRLYHLDDSDGGGAAATLLYGTLSEALALAAEQPADVQEGLFLQTSNDVVSYLDFIEG